MKEEAWDSHKRDLVREWLKQYRTVSRNMKALESLYIEEGKSIDGLKAVTYDDHQPHSGNAKSDEWILRHIGKLEEVSEAIGALDGEYFSMSKDVFSVFNRLECHDAACALMIARYMRGMKWADVAEEVGYSQKMAEAIHKKCLLECYDLMPHEYRERIPMAV